MNKKVVFVDFDGTIIRGQSQVLLIKYLYLLREINLFLLLKVIVWGLKYKLGNQKIEKNFATGIYRIVLAGRREKQTEEIIDTFIDKVIDRAVYKKILGLLYDYKEKGYDVIVVSSTLDIILSAFNKKYPIADEIICTKLEGNKGEYTGELVGNINDGLEREGRVLSIVDREKFSDMVVITDNVTDLNILRKANRAVVVNPNRKMTKFAKSFNFEIIKT